MEEQRIPSFLFPPCMSDEAAYQIAEFLAAFSLAFEQHYFAQIRRHLQELDPKPSELSDHPWEDEPF